MLAFYVCWQSNDAKHHSSKKKLSSILCMLAVELMQIFTPQQKLSSIEWCWQSIPTFVHLPFPRLCIVHLPWCPPTDLLFEVEDPLVVAWLDGHLGRSDRLHSDDHRWCNEVCSGWSPRIRLARVVQPSSRAHRSFRSSCHSRHMNASMSLRSRNRWHPRSRIGKPSQTVTVPTKIGRELVVTLNPNGDSPNQNNQRQQ